MQLELATLTLGPAIRRQAADYGLRTRGLRLSGEAELLLEDAALALAEWGKAHGGAFELLLWLGDRQGQYALLKAAHLGPGAMGPIVVAQGLLVPEREMQSIGRRAHRLLPAIPAPSLDAWDASSVSLAWDPAEARLAQRLGGPQAPSDAMERLGLQLASAALPWPAVEVAAGSDEAGEAARLAAVDAVPWHRLAVRPSWVTAAGLPSLGSFAPRRAALTVRPVTEMAAGSARSTAPLDPPSPALDLFLALFDTAARLDERQAGPISPAAREALDAAAWEPAWLRLSQTDALVAALGAMVAKGLSSSDFWDVLAATAAAAALLPDAQRAAAAEAVARFFGTSASSEPAAFARLLGRYVERVWPPLRGEGHDPLDWAIERRVLTRLAPEDFAVLVRVSGDRLPVQAMAHALDEETNAGGALTAEASALLLAELNRRYEGRPLDREALRLLASTLQAARPAGSDAPPEVLGRLRDAVWGSLGLLFGEPARAVEGWWREALRFVPRLIALLADSGGGSALVRIIRDAREVLMKRPLLDAGSGGADDEGFLSLLLVHSAVLHGTSGGGR